MHSQDGHIGLIASAWREGGLWRIRLSGPDWLLADLAAELAETNQQLDLAGDIEKDDLDRSMMCNVSAIVLVASPRRKRAPRRRSTNADTVIGVDREAFFRP